MESTASHIRDKDIFSAQLDVVRLNDGRTIEMVKLLVEMVSKFSSDVQLIGNDNEALKIQLRDLHQTSYITAPLPHIYLRLIKKVIS
jgi:hypothetical protein